MKPIALFVFSLAAAAAATLAAQDPPTPDDLPQDEAGLLEHAQGLLYEGQPERAEQACRRFIERFPKSARLAEAHGLLCDALGDQGRDVDARAIIADFVEKHPTDPGVWNMRARLAWWHQHQSRADEARKLWLQIAREAPDLDDRTNAIKQMWQIDRKGLIVAAGKSFDAGQDIKLESNIHGFDKISFRVQRIACDTLARAIESGSPDIGKALVAMRTEKRTLVKEWTREYEKKGEYSHGIEFPGGEPGLYVLEATHDGFTIPVPVYVTRYALITKVGRDKLVVFAQERATGKPVAGMKIRTLNPKAPVGGETDANGLLVVTGYKGGAVFGSRDGDVVASGTWGVDLLESQPVVYFTTDRPIYRPNDTVRFKVVHRQLVGETHTISAGLKAVVVIEDPRDNVVHRQTVTLDAFGTASGSFALGDEPPLGRYRLKLRPEGNRQRTAGWQYHWWSDELSPVDGRFNVEEYRKPEYKVAVSFKDVRVLQGEPLTATIQADYYFGSPVADAEIEWTAHRAPDWSWAWWDWYYEWYEDENYLADRWIGSEETNGKGRTDKDGRLVVTFASQKHAEDSVYTVTATATDLSRRQVTGAGTAKAVRSDIALTAAPTRWVQRAGERVTLKIRATAGDAPARDTDVTLKVNRRSWKKDEPQDAAVFEGSTKTDANGLAEISFVPVEAGYLRAVASAKDARGNETTAEAWVWVASDAWEGSGGGTETVEILPDKKTYKPGDTASVLITTTQKNLTCLVTLESRSIYHQEVVRFKGHAKLVELKLDRPEYAPTVHVCVTAIRGDDTLQSSRALIVDPTNRFIAVKVTSEKGDYRPREKTRYTIETTGADGKPVSADVELGVVDEAIYAVQPEHAKDIRRHFVPKRWNEVATYSSLNYSTWGSGAFPLGDNILRVEEGAMQSLEQAKGTPLTGAVFEEGGHAATETRSRFADTMTWVANVRTDERGRAVVEADVPDNLTSWRATARASTLDMRFGQGVSNAVSRKNVIVRLQMPRFLTQNDETTVTAIAHNYLAVEKEFKVVLEAAGLEVAGAREASVKLAPNGQRRFDWKARAKAPGTATVTVKLLSDVESDAMQLPVPIQPHGTPHWTSFAGFVEGRAEQKFTIPADGPSAVTLVLSPTHAASVLDALDYLAGYPYGCVEQTMSRFLPCVIVAETIGRLGLEKPELLKELPKMVAAGLQRLANFQHDDGGWGWWQHDKSAPHMTAHVMVGLAVARGAGFAVEDRVFKEGVNALRAHLADEKTADASARASLLYALSLCGQKDDAARGKLLEEAERLETYARALLALVLHRDGRADDAKRVLALVDKARDGGSWKGEGDGWFDHPVEIAAAALRAYVAIDPKHAAVPRGIAWLSSMREGRQWASTKQTALVVQALCEHLVASGEREPDMTLTLSLNGARVMRERVTKETWQKFQRVRTLSAAAGENTVVLEKEGSGTPMWSLYVKTWTVGEGLAASQGGLRVSRRYGRVTHAGDKRMVEPLEDGAAVKSGDEIEVTLTVTADRTYEHLMLEDPLPSGFEPVREYWDPWSAWENWYARKEFRDERVCAAMTEIPRGDHVVRYSMRAETPGDLHVLPARVWSMYHAQIGGNSAESRIKVIDR